MKPYELSVFKVLPVSFHIFSQYPTNIFYKCSRTRYLPSLSSNLLYFILSHSSVARSLKLLYSFIISLLFSRISCKKQNALKTLPPCYEHCYDHDNIVLILKLSISCWNLLICWLTVETLDCLSLSMTSNCSVYFFMFFLMACNRNEI